MVKSSSNGFLKSLLIIFFMLFAVDFGGMGWYIFGATFGLAVLYVMFTHKDVVIDPLFGWVILLAIFNFLIMFINSETDIVTKVIKYLMSPIGGYFIGSLLASEEKEKNSGIIKLYMFAVIPYLAHGILDLAAFEGFEGFEREIPDFWTGEMWKATLVCTYFAMTAPLCLISLVAKGVFKKIAYFLLTAVSVYACIVTASRTVIYLGIIVIFLEFILYMSEGRSIAEKTKILTIVAILVAVIVVVVMSHMDSLSETQFFSRMTESDMSEEPRIQLFMNIIDNFWRYPFGNMPFFYSHNTWLDFLRESGWITFACFFVITVLTIKHMVLIFKNKSLNQESRIAVIGMMSALLLDMFVEPVMDGAAILFCLFFYFIGVNSQYIGDKKRRKKDV